VDQRMGKEKQDADRQDGSGLKSLIFVHPGDRLRSTMLRETKASGKGLSLFTIRPRDQSVFAKEETALTPI